MKTILAFLLLTTLSTFAQKQKKYFTDNAGIKVATKAEAKYHREVTKKDSFRVVKDYYLNGSLQMIAHYTDRRLKHPIDTVKFYYLNGNLSNIGCYSNGKKHGEWKWYYLNGSLSKAGNYNNGNATGNWNWFDIEGKNTKTIENANDSLITHYLQSPKFPGGEKAFFKFLNEMKKPEKSFSQGFYGVVYTSFYLNEKGRAEDIDVLIHGTSEMDSIVISQLKEMPAWMPASKDGKPIGVRMVLHVSFAIMSGKKYKVNLSNNELAKYFYNSGIDDYFNKEYEKARFKFEQAISLDNINPKYYKNLAICCDKLKEAAITCEYFKVANILDPNIVESEIKAACNF